MLNFEIHFNNKINPEYKPVKAVNFKKIFIMKKKQNVLLYFFALIVL